jgi:hypothetical protein
MTYSTEMSDFIKSGASRETCDQIMNAIAKIARNASDAKRIWEDPTDAEVCAIAEIATQNGADGVPSDYCWGWAGNDWADQ